MVKIKYVGVKTDGERAFKADTGIEWFPGHEHEVSEEHAAKMLRHPDVFEQVTGAPVKPAKQPALRAVAADQDEVDDEAIAREEAAKKAAAAVTDATGSDAAEAGKQENPGETEQDAKAAAKKTPAKKAAAKKSAAKGKK